MDIEDLSCNTSTNTYSSASCSTTITTEKKAKLHVFMKDFIRKTNELIRPISPKDIDNVLRELLRIYRIHPTKNELRYMYLEHFNHLHISQELQSWLIKSKCRKTSGVLVVTVVLAPSWGETASRKGASFSCSKKCSYCPTETDLDGNPTQPKSYLSGEPAMLRATTYNFDVFGQVSDRFRSYIRNGIISLAELRDPQFKFKTEIIVSGGTWECYPKDYRDSVIHEIYWACNVFGEMLTVHCHGDSHSSSSSSQLRPITTDCKIAKEFRMPHSSLELEMKSNEYTKFRVIGMTLETRPDFITHRAIREYRRYGATRIQMGVQHFDDLILDKIKRECYTKDTIQAIRLLKQTGFKVVVHLMPDLPESSPEKDKWMFEQAITQPDLQFDDVKIYPTAVCKSHTDTLLVKSDIADWYERGLYTPYSETNLQSLIDVLTYYLENMSPWVRIQRLVRDIPAKEIEAGYQKTSNLRQILDDTFRKQGKKCMDIRFMEIKDREYPITHTREVVYHYKASGGDEYHIQMEAHTLPWYYDMTYMLYLFLYGIMYVLFGNTDFYYYHGNRETYDALYGFCRLRLDTYAGGFLTPTSKVVFPELQGCALIREVHVYGSSMSIGSSHSNSQHNGYGKRMVRMAETIARQKGFKKIAVIAGNGTREYYEKKCGYSLPENSTYMIKSLE
jgi:ELP3 family radical SAM enzyme/protein acetyltransferase